MLQLLRIIRILNSDASPSAIATAVCLAMVIGLTPLLSLHNILILLVVLMFRVHLGTFLLFALGFGLVGLAFESSLDNIGYWLLSNDALNSLWTSFYNTQFGRLSLFNYTQMMGGLFISLTAFLPMWLISLFIIQKYRHYFLDWMKQNNVVQVLRGSSLFQLYQRGGGD